MIAIAVGPMVVRLVVAMMEAIVGLFAVVGAHHHQVQAQPQVVAWWSIVRLPMISL